MKTVPDIVDVDLYTNVTWIPCRQAVPRRPATSGVFTEDGTLIKESLLVRHLCKPEQVIEGRPDLETDPNIVKDYIVRPGKVGETSRKLNGRYVFGGYFFKQYGHFLLETLARLWFFKQFPHIPIVWMCFGSQKVTDWHMELLSTIRVENQVIFLDEQVEIEELLIPEPGVVLAIRFWEKQAQAYDITPHKDIQPGKKVWLSRTKLNKAIWINEPLIESFLLEAGWIIYHPQDHAVVDQLAMLNDAEVVAGVEGSAFHSFVLLPNFGGKIVLFDRIESGNYELVADRYRHNFERVKIDALKLTRAPKMLPGELNMWVPDIDRVLQALGESRPKLDAGASSGAGGVDKIVSHTSRALACKAMMELGAHSNTVCLLDDIEVATLVSDQFRFSLGDLKSKVRRQIDIDPAIMLSATTYSEVVDLYCFRDIERGPSQLPAFTSTLEYSHARTVWLFELQWPNGTNMHLLSRLIEEYPLLSMVRISGTQVVFLWKEKRPFAIPQLHKYRLPDYGQPEKPNIPELSLTDCLKRVSSTITFNAF